MKMKPNMWASAKRLVLIVIALVLMSATSIAQGSSRDLPTLLARGSFEEVARLAPDQIASYSKPGRIEEAARSAEIACRAFNQLGRYEAANEIVEKFASDLKLRSSSPRTTAALYLCKAAVSRSQRNLGEAYQNLRLAKSIAGIDPIFLSAYQLEVGRTLYSGGHDFASIVWLEQAERNALSSGQTVVYLDALRFLSLAWTAKFYYSNALSYAEKLVEKASVGRYEHRNRVAHLELANLLNLTGQPRRSKELHKKGLSLSTMAGTNYHACQFLSSLLLGSLFDNDIESAKKYLASLESTDEQKQFTFETLLGRAVIENFNGNAALSEQYFAKVANEKGTSDFVVPYWKSTIAEREQNWPALVASATQLRKLTEEANFHDDLPGIYYKLALGALRSGNRESARKHATKALSLFEPFRNDKSVGLSIAMMDVHHSIYRLLCEIELSENSEKALEYSEQLKANLLRFKIEGSILKRRPDLSESVRKGLLDISLNYVEGNGSKAALTDLENSVTGQKQIDGNRIHNFSNQDLELPEGVAIVSYAFMQSGRLAAFILEPSKTLRTVSLNITDRQVAQFASETHLKIKDRIFFKNDGKKLYDLLLKPLDLKSHQLVLVPDQLLWRIPFHALSPDGTKYLIETTAISYSPSVYLLKQQLSSQPPRRRTIQIFANDTFNSQKLAYVNSEAETIGKQFGVSPFLKASRADFIRSARGSDILHFSMHAQLDGENPLSSYLAFSQLATDSGRLTVNDLLAITLKPGNLAFLASCDTSKVYYGEGLVSIPWAFFGSGSTSVVSSQWGASDKATQVFSTAFYADYLKGLSASAALQNSAISMINNKNSGFHEPYFWAAFSLQGDFR